MMKVKIAVCKLEAVCEPNSPHSRNVTRNIIRSIYPNKLVVLHCAGALFSLISAVQVLSGALGFVLYSLSYKTSLGMNWSWRAGSSFWLMAVLYAIAIPLL